MAALGCAVPEFVDSLPRVEAKAEVGPHSPFTSDNGDEISVIEEPPKEGSIVRSKRGADPGGCLSPTGPIYFHSAVIRGLLVREPQQKVVKKLSGQWESFI
jgi:hypothetical protein